MAYRLLPWHTNPGNLDNQPIRSKAEALLNLYKLTIASSQCIPEVLALHPIRGALFETWVVAEFVKGRFKLDMPADLYFWRDNNGLEADLVFEIGTRLQPVEIKSGQTVTRDYLRAGQASGRFAGDEALPPWLIYRGNESYERSGVRVLGWSEIPTAAVPPELVVTRP